MATLTEKIRELEQSTTWNYILVGTAILTMIISIRNISIYTRSITAGKEMLKEE